MPEERKHVTLRLPTELVDRIDHYAQTATGCTLTRNQAAEALIGRALDAWEEAHAEDEEATR